MSAIRADVFAALIYLLHSREYDDPSDALEDLDTLAETGHFSLPGSENDATYDIQEEVAAIRVLWQGLPAALEDL